MRRWCGLGHIGESDCSAKLGNSAASTLAAEHLAKKLSGDLTKKVSGDLTKKVSGDLTKRCQVT